MKYNKIIQKQHCSGCCSVYDLEALPLEMHQVTALPTYNLEVHGPWGVASRQPLRPETHIDRPLFNPSRDLDVGLIQAVQTAF